MGDCMIRSFLNWLLYEWGYARSIVGNEGGFVHKKLLGVVSKVAGAGSFIPGIGGTLGAVSGITGRLAGRGPATARPTLSRTLTARPSFLSRAGQELGRALKFGPEAQQLPGRGIVSPPAQLPRFQPLGVHPQDEGPCLPGLIRGPQGLCIAPTSPLGASRLVGEATMGQYGAALIPGSQIVDRATCLRGMQLGNDGLCYNKGQITNKQRMWPAGRKPLLSGGDMRAISTAARAGRRMELATKQLQKMGMMKKPARRGTPWGHRAKLVHASDH